LIVRRLMAPLAVVAFISLHAGQGSTQGTFPVTAPASGQSEACSKEFVPLREEAEKRGRLIKAAADRRAAPDEACKLIGNFGAAEIKMIKYVEANAQKCGISAQVTDQLKAGHKKTEALQQKVCGMAQQTRQSPYGPVQINDIGDPAMERLLPIAPR
jgi:hypothetical protein